MQYLIQFLKKRKFMLIMVIFSLIGQVVGTLLVPFLIANIIDIGIMKSDIDSVIKIGVWMLIVAFVTAIISVLGSYLSANFAAIFSKDMREKIFRKTQELSIKDFDTFGTSSMITRTTIDITNIQQTLVMFLQMIVPAPLIAISSIIMTMFVSPVLTIIPVISIIVFVFMAYIILKKSELLSKQVQIRMDRINQIVRESIIGIRVIRAFDNSEYEKNRNDKTFEEYASTMISLNKLFAVFNPVAWLVTGLSMAAIVYFGGFLVADGIIAIGKITSVIEYTVMTLGYLIMASFSVVTLPKMYACLKRLSEVLDTKQEIEDKSKNQLVSLKNIVKLEFDNVVFSYHGAEKPVLHNISFCCNIGQTTAIIGGTGSGKSTIANLLLRLYDVDSGHIRLNGIDINNFLQHELREQIGYVPQKNFLFSGTIADNLRMGNKEASDNEMRKAVWIAQAESFIDSLQKGFYSPVSQGGINFSGGQKQRLSIARALIKNAPIFVFDDSFSALDFKTDFELRKALKHEIDKSIILIIAQRISTIMDADQIIVLDEGQIVGIGKHDELIKTCLIYQEIANSQLSMKEEKTI